MARRKWIIFSIQNSEQNLQYNIFIIMQQKKTKKMYNVIPYEVRKQLIDRVITDQERLTQVSKQLNIKLSTAKYILKQFRKKGKIMKKVQPQVTNSQDFNNENVLPIFIYYPIYLYCSPESLYMTKFD